MEELVKAIQAKDLTKTQRLFNESMQPLVANIIKERAIAVARAIIIEGEEPKRDDEDEDDDDDEESEED